MLIQAVNAKLYGFTSYHRVEDSFETFKHIDISVSVLLMKLLKQIYPQKDTKMLINKYWYTNFSGKQTFTLTTNKSIQIIHLEDVILIEHKKIDIRKNIFLDQEYFKNRIDFLRNVTCKWKI